MTVLYKQFFLLAGIYFLSWQLQSTLLIGWDPSWGLHEAQRLLNGGVEGKDYFEATPPLFLYLYALPVILAKYTAVSQIVLFRIYIFILATISLLLCNRLLTAIIADTFQRGIFLILLACCFLILPLPYDIGNREHLLLIFCLPYYLLMVARLDNKKIPMTYVLLIGLFGGIGFLIKPFFMISFAAIEAYYLYAKKSYFAWARTETLTVIVLAIVYTIALYTLFPSYFSIILPYSHDLYYIGYKENFETLITQPVLIFCCAAIAFYYIQSNNSLKNLRVILFITLISFLISYFLQQTSFYYHLLPAYAMALLLIFFSTDSRQIGLVLAIFPIYLTTARYEEGLIYKQKISPLIAFMQKEAYEQPVMFFSSMITYEFPAVDYAKAIPASQYGVLSWVVGLRKHPGYRTLAIQTEENYFIHSLAYELNYNQPKLIFVDVQSHKPHLENINFEFLPYFLKNPSFQTAWKNYHYLTTLEDKSFYKFDVYTRSNI